MFGYYNASNIRSLDDISPLVSADSIHKEIDIDRPSFIEVKFFDDRDRYLNGASVIAFPGDSIHIRCNPYDETKAWIVFGGTNAAGQQAYNDTDYHPARKFAPIDALLSILPGDTDGFLEKVETAITDETSDFKQLANAGRVTEQFLELIKTYYRASYYAHIFGILTRTNIPLDLAKKKDILAIQFANLPADSPRYYSIKNFLIYLNDHCIFRISDKLGIENPNDLHTKGNMLVGDSVITIDDNFFWRTNMEDGQLREDLWALSLMGIIKTFRSRYDSTILEQFNAVFPESRWSSLIHQQFADYYRPDTIQYVQTVPTEILDSIGNYGSFRQLFEEGLKGDRVYVDLWATWCLPCVSSFKYNKDIDPFLHKHGIKRLYISIDNLAHSERWLADIERYKLGGQHALCGQLVYDDLLDALFPDGKETLAIPRYLLVNENGEIVETSAHGPDDSQKLFEQIRKAFKIE
ncbi:TlpA family protein disulfide reductase [Parapedobacter tibetensis]|uniref:TlpA family protein disulfide reductase n=1 Tax=Parapedobacter tibetensis TaxID=2972951 RepID=UPI00214DD1BD|nr:redoxin family protein [Parapedobacter tibetensis]